MGLSLSRIAILVALIVVAAAALILIPTSYIIPSGFTSVTALASSSVDAGMCTVPPCAEQISGWLHTVPGDSRIYDTSGHVVRLVGLNVMGLEYGTGNSASDSCKFGWGGQDAGFFSTAEFDNIASWGFNFVRLPISWENLEPSPPSMQPDGSWMHYWNKQYLNEIDYFVNQFGQRHIAVLPDFHQVDLSPAFQHAPGGVHGIFCEGWGMPTWLYPSITSPSTGGQVAAAMCSFFMDQSLVGTRVPSPLEGLTAAEQLIASRYANNPTVIGLDIFNEPWFSRSCGNTETETRLLVNFDARISSAISTANPHLLIVFEDPPHGLMPQLTSPLISSPPAVPNAVYEVHVYVSNWEAAEPLLAGYLINAKKWGIPLYLGEFNAFEAGNNAIYATVDPNWQADTRSMLQYCKTNAISWSYWSYTSLGTKVPTPVPKTEILSILRNGI